MRVRQFVRRGWRSRSASTSRCEDGRSRGRCYDLLPLGRRVLSDQPAYPFAEHDVGALRPAIPLCVPAGGRDLLRGLASLCPLPAAPILDRVLDLALDVREYRPGQEFELGDCHVTMHGLRHALPNCGARVRGPAATLAYTGDTGVSGALHTLAADAGLLLAEATLDRTDGTSHGHLSAADAARAAQAAGAAQVMLTHLPMVTRPGTRLSRPRPSCTSTVPCTSPCLAWCTSCRRTGLVVVTGHACLSPVRRGDRRRAAATASRATAARAKPAFPTRSVACSTGTAGGCAKPCQA
ncbi:MBL fold metallo-hydrolase [Nonomuraea rubra]|uniref:MBL fold metallo-hydrolase n=1 Tax=Nonomuraea rubra TaxID=46180 RepID=UPI0033C8DF7B